MSREVRNIRLVLEYDGAGFYGFQRQPKHLSVQQVLEEALGKLFNRPMKIAAASGRTDTGVHALGQVVNFHTDAPLPAAQIQRALNGILPRSMAVRDVTEVPAQFHARYSAKEKTYEFHVWNHPVRSPLESSRAHHVAEKLNISAMQRAARHFKGKKDFRSFCASGSGKEDKSTVRTVREFRILKRGPRLIFRVTANGFLYHMVRNMVGTLLEVGRGKRSSGDIAGILKARDRRHAGVTAPALGLMLVSVKY